MFSISIPPWVLGGAKTKKKKSGAQKTPQFWFFAGREFFFFYAPLFTDCEKKPIRTILSEIRINSLLSRSFEHLIGIDFSYKLEKPYNIFSSEWCLLPNVQDVSWEFLIIWTVTLVSKLLKAGWLNDWIYISRNFELARCSFFRSTFTIPHCLVESDIDTKIVVRAWTWSFFRLADWKVTVFLNNQKLAQGIVPFFQSSISCQYIKSWKSK